MGWFTPKCPVDPETKEWIDEAFQWLVDELGIEVIRQTEVVLPIPDYFPDEFDGSESSVRTMLARVCAYMDVDESSIRLSFESDDDPEIHPLAHDGKMRQHVLGSYKMGPDGKYGITLDIGQVRFPERLIATIAHELGHVILLGEDRLDPKYPDHEPMTDLVTVFYGLGIFNANAAVVFEQWTNAQYQGWQISSGGYLSEEMYGYALALFAAIRGETKPDWAQYLTTNVKSYLKSSLKFIQSTGLAIVDRSSERPVVDAVV